jgi:serine protease Do
MRALAAALLIVATGARADPLEETERAQEQLFDAVAPSVVYLISSDKIGSGFFVDGEGLVLTNQHVVGDRTEVTAVLQDGRKIPAKVVHRADQNVDLVLLRVSVHGKPLVLGSGGLRVGSWVASVGHGMGGAWTFTTGMVSNIYPLEGERPVFQTQIPLNPGNSGGPIVDRQGMVVGIATARISEASNMNFAIRSEVALQSFPELEASCACLTIEAPKDVSVLVDGQMVGKGPRLVIPASRRTYRVQAIVGGVLKELSVAWPDRRRVAFEGPPLPPPRTPVRPAP